MAGTFCSNRPSRAAAGSGRSDSLKIAVGSVSAGVPMYFEQFYLTCLAHASYMIGSEGEAAVIDPQRDVDIYLKAAEENNLKIKYIFETSCANRRDDLHRSAS
jgi:hypothetical protein